jgi:hypothetical protein
VVELLLEAEIVAVAEVEVDIGTEVEGNFELNFKY